MEWNPKRFALPVVDALIFVACWIIAFALRWGLAIPADDSILAGDNYALLLRLLLPWVVLAHLGIYWVFGAYRGVLRYAGSSELKGLAAANMVLFGGLLLMNVFLHSREQLGDLPIRLLDARTGETQVLRVPYIVLTVYTLLAALATAAVRFGPRMMMEQAARHADQESPATLIVGAGDPAEATIRNLLMDRAATYRPVCAVAEVPARVGLKLHGVPVVGTIDKIPLAIEQQKIEQVLIALDDPKPEMLRQVVAACENAEVRFRTVPSLRDLREGRVEVASLREIEIEDLLGREPVRVELKPERNYVRGECVLITGAGGSIGSELARQVAAAGATRVVLLGRGENSIFDIHRELIARHKDIEFIPFIGDVRDYRRMERLFEQHMPAIVLHAAAHKHVPLMEDAPDEAVGNNVLGTANLAVLADRFECKRFVLISSDKAVRPASVMGATKRLAEMVIMSIARNSTTAFVAVRFGNVLGSRGSVIHVFREQIRQGGPVKVTHPDVERYFMTIPEAVALVLQASSRQESGVVYLLDMGQPIRIRELARNMITLSGLRPDIDIAIEYIGLRPGEKLKEDLLTAEEGTRATEMEKIHTAQPHDIPSWQEMERLLELLQDNLPRASRRSLLKFLQSMVPDYHPAAIMGSEEEEQTPWLTKTPPEWAKAEETYTEEMPIPIARTPLPEPGIAPPTTLERLPLDEPEFVTPSVEFARPDLAEEPAAIDPDPAEEPAPEPMALQPDFIEPDLFESEAQVPAPAGPEATTEPEPLDEAEPQAQAPTTKEVAPTPVEEPRHDATPIEEPDAFAQWPASGEVETAVQVAEDTEPAIPEAEVPVSPAPPPSNPTDTDIPILKWSGEGDKAPDAPEELAAAVEESLFPEELEVPLPEEMDPAAAEVELAVEPSAEAAESPFAPLPEPAAAPEIFNPKEEPVEMASIQYQPGPTLVLMRVSAAADPDALALLVPQMKNSLLRKGDKLVCLVDKDSADKVPAEAEVLNIDGRRQGDVIASQIAANPSATMLVTLTSEVLLAAGAIDALVDALAAGAPLAYANFDENKGGKITTVVPHDHEGCPHERFEYGPMIAYNINAIKGVGGIRTDLAFAWEYDLHLKLMEKAPFKAVRETLYTHFIPVAPEGKGSAVYSPGMGPLGGFSYVFYPPDMEREVTSVWEDALKRRGAWIDHETAVVDHKGRNYEVMVTVVTPILNRVKFIGNAIERLQQQTYKNWELVIVDNGSTDGTIDKIKEYAAKDDRIRLLHGKGGSIASALNEGIKAARGKYIGQLDSDDEYHPDCIEKMVETLEKNPKCGLAISYYCLMDEKGVVIKDIPPVTHGGYSRNQIIRRDGAGATRFFVKAVLEEMGYYDEEHYGNFGEDYDMVVKVGEKYDVDRVHHVLYHYRRHSDNTDVTRDPVMKYKNKNRARQEALRRRLAINKKLGKA